MRFKKILVIQINSGFGGGVSGHSGVWWDLGVSERGITVVTVGVTATSRALGLNVKGKILIVVCC